MKTLCIMALVTLKALCSKRIKVVIGMLLFLSAFSVLANDLGVSAELLGNGAVSEPNVIQDVPSGSALEVAPEIMDVPNISSTDEAVGKTVVDEGYYEELLNNVREAKQASPASLGPIIVELKTPVVEEIQLPPSNFLLDHVEPWLPAMAPILDVEPESLSSSLDSLDLPDKEKSLPPSEMLAVDKRPPVPRIAILIDDLGYNRHGMESSLILPKEVALAILPSTPFASKTAHAAQEQGRVTLLHAPMENQRELKLGPGGLYANMTKQELQLTLNKDIDGLPGIQGVNNHMGSLLTTKQQPMNWVMETLTKRSLFFIDSLTSSKSVAGKTAKDYGLKTVSRDVFLDNIRTEKAIDRQFNRLIKLARRHGSALAIGHPYPETTAYLKKRLQQLKGDGVELVSLLDVLLPPKDQYN